MFRSHPDSEGMLSWAETIKIACDDTTLVEKVI